MDRDRDLDPRVETLSEAECLHLLATVPVGRVVYTAHALPAVLPVAFEVDADGRLLLALRRGGTVSRALDDTVAAFQADRLDPASRTGWSVLVRGRAEVVTDPVLHERLLRQGPRCWVGEAEPMFVAITPELVTGRLLAAPGREARPS
ncbi:pyridoxamine 5'-phosphate oxidase family protein [Kitasatospora sp. NPDC050543]|uniref:pyridoxamine 5'-phosphate oxidase family protein n=1 Tax=Kitasatospora sp. NPDC050543 TaxID=3364054 RepID=UPI0037B771ED